ncbi:MAG: efflux RND transporter permease subunit [Chromatiales bacterium]|nr:MAG: efflux RND transporter permease subunit [Chromatiales bacterium]
MSFITRFALDVNRLTVVFILTVIILGVSLFLDFPRQEDPPIVIREVVVTAFFPGMDSADVEELIARDLEAELRSLPELDDIWSDSMNGVAVLQAETRDEFDDLDLIWQKVRNRMIDAKPRLPAGTIGPFVNDEFGLTAVATIALTSEGFSMAEMRLTARDIRDRLYEIPGTRKVELYGVQEERVFLKFSASALPGLGIAPQQIVQTLVEQNVVLPGGRVDASRQDVIVSPTGNFRSVEDIENVEIALPDTQQTIRLKDVAQVVRDYADPPRELVYFNGQPAITISVSITPNVNAVGFGAALTAKLARIENQLPIGYALEYATFQPDLVEAAVNGGLNNVYQTLVIVLVVVMLFLGVRTGLIVGSFVPMTMLLGMILMRVVGVELERVSIASSIIALGMLVDNGIVIAEEIRSRLERGQDKREACIETGATLAIPLLTSSLTTIFAFLPMLLMMGQTGEYAFSLPMVVTLLLLGSWFLSMYMTPAMCFWFMTVKASGQGEAGAEQADPYGGRFYTVYRGFVRAMLRARFIVVLAALGAMAGGLFLASQMTREFFGTSDRNQFLVYIDLPAGYRIDSTDRVVQRVNDWLLDEDVNPEVTSTIAYVGTGGPRFFLVLDPVQPNPHVAFMVVNTESYEQTPAVVRRLRQYFIDEVPEAIGRVKEMWLGSAEPGFVEVRLFGPDKEVLYEKGSQLVNALRAMPGSLDVISDWENRVPKARIVVDQARARRAQVSSRDVSRALLSQMDGLPITDYREGDLAIPVLARNLPEERRSPGDLWNVQVTSSATGELVPLPQIADITGEWAFFRISRRNQERCLTVEVKHETLLAPELLAATLPMIEDLELGPDYHWEPGGEIEQGADTMAQLTRTLPLAITGIVVLLIWQFNSFRRPLIIFITIPLAFTGAFLGLNLLRAPFDFFALLGLLSLAGVIINNGIVLIDRIDVVRAEGGDPYEAIVDAAVTRLRPILMATVTTILGLMPLILSQDSLFYSMAINMASGLLFGTVLTLGVVPVLYAVLFRVKVPG